MNKFTWVITYLVLFIILTTVVSAVSISLRPAKVNVPNLIQGGYYEVEYVLAYGSDEPTKVELSVDQNDEIAQWIRFEPNVDEFFVSKDNPQTIKMIIEPPPTVANGNYGGTVRFSIKNKATAEGSTSMVIQPGLASLLNITISSNEISDCRVLKSSITDIELFEDIPLNVEVYNNGNIDVKPVIKYTIKSLNNTVKLEGKGTEEVIRPTQRKTIITDIEQDLKPGQYFIDIEVPNCQEFKKSSTFDILEWGAKSLKASLVNLRTENVWNYVGDNIKLFAIVKNTGKNKIKEAQFIGNITLNDVFVEEVKTKIVNIDPGETITFKETFSPKHSGRYQLKGTVFYDGKETFEKIAPINVNPKQGKDSIFSIINIILFVALMVVIGLVIVTIKRKKSTKKKTHHKKTRRKRK